MEVFNYLETANFLKVQTDEFGNQLTDIQKINKIKNMFQGGILPKLITVSLGSETLVIRDKLEEYLDFKWMAKQYSLSKDIDANNFEPIQNVETKIPKMRTIKETALITKVPEGRIREMVKKGQISHLKCGKKALINLDKFIEFLNANNGDLNSKNIDNKYGIKRIDL